MANYSCAIKFLLFNDEWFNARYYSSPQPLFSYFTVDTFSAFFRLFKHSSGALEEKKSLTVDKISKNKIKKKKKRNRISSSTFSFKYRIEISCLNDDIFTLL